MDELNEKYEKAIVEDLAKKLKGAGFTLTNWKVTGILITIIITLIGVVYGNLVSVQAAQQNEISSLQGEHATLNAVVQNMATNIYLLCEASVNAHCVKPENLLQSIK